MLKLTEKYKKKFSAFIDMCYNQTHENQLICVACPEILGDTYDELIQSLNVIADSNKRLIIAKEGYTTFK